MIIRKKNKIIINYNWSSFLPMRKKSIYSLDNKSELAIRVYLR